LVAGSASMLARHTLIPSNSWSLIAQACTASQMFQIQASGLCMGSRCQVTARFIIPWPQRTLRYITLKVYTGIYWSHAETLALEFVVHCGYESHCSAIHMQHGSIIVPQLM
jgi:hypothetical protein